jgi:small subunit ribosomal protein S16
MEVRIRLQRVGNKAQKHYNYRIVAVSKKTARQTRHIEQIGYYDAAANPSVVSFDQAKLDKWISQGAQMSDTVKSLVKKTLKSA